MSSARRPGTSSRNKTPGSSVRSSSGTSSSARDRAAAPTASARSSADRASAFTTSSSGGVTRSDRSGGTSSSNGSGGGGGRSRDVGRSRSGEGLSKLPPQESLMEIVQKRFVDDVFESAAKAHPGWKILIVDEPGMKVISSAVGMYDIMERQISIVESLDKKRAPFKDMPAVYILGPTKDSVRKLIADYEDKTKVLYGKSVFVFFLGPISNSLIDEIKGCKQLIKRLKALSEINVDFLVQESRAFTMDVDAPFGSYYLRSSGASSAEKNLADKLVTLCATLNEYPYIRYKQGSGVCSSLAAIFKVKMDDYVKSNPSWWYHGSGNCPIRNGERDRSTLLLLDRASDCLTPLMHDFTYQAMVHDLLKMEGDKITYQAEKADNPSQKEDKDVLLNEKDSVWVEMRGNHIAQVIEVLSSRINEVVNSSTTRVHKGSSSNMSISELASALKDLPEYREVMSKLSQHLHIAHDCMDKFNRAGLLDLADVEQTLATGKDEDGRSPKLTETISRCESALIRIQNPEDRLRLILIATISQNGLSSADRDRLLRAAQLGRNELQTLESLNRIGINTVSNDYATPTSGANSFFGSVKSKLSSSSSFDEESEYASSRYSPPLKAILNDLVTNQLSTDEYPSVIPMPLSATSTTSVSGSARRRAKGTEGSLRKSKGGATDKWSKMGNSMTKSTTSGAANFTGGRNLVFMVGGLSYSELRVARDIMERESREIIAGSTKFVNPSEFLEDLHTLTG